MDNTGLPTSAVVAVTVSSWRLVRQMLDPSTEAAPATNSTVRNIPTL